MPNQNSGEINKIAEFLSGVKHIKGVRVLPYHNLSGNKYGSLEIEYSLNNSDTPIPTNEETENARKILESHGLKVLR